MGERSFLASIVPNPKAGLYHFLPDGSLRPGLVRYFNSLGNMMAGHGRAQRDSSDYGFYTVKLKESLRQEIAPVNESVADSLMNQTTNDDAAPVILVQPEVK